MASYSRRREDDDAGEPPTGDATDDGASEVHDPRDDVDPLDLPEEEQLVYDLGEWPLDVHAEVAAALAEAGITHSWLGTDLVVHERQEDRADVLLTQIEQRHGLVSDESGEAPPREPGSELEYDMADWSGEARALLTGRLIEGDIPFRWEGALLVTAASEEALVDAVIDDVEQTLEDEGLSTGEDDPGESPISHLFVAVDDLTNHPNDRDAILRLNARFEEAEAGPVPFGLQPASWDRILDQVSDLLELSLESDDVDDVKAEAAELRATLRPLV